MDVALGDVAPVAAQGLQRRQILNALGDEVGAKAVRKCHGGAHDGDGPRIAGQTCDKDLVELEFIDGEILQAGQRGPAGAVIVEREADSESPQRGDRLAGAP